MRLHRTITACILAGCLLHPTVANAQARAINQGDQIIAAEQDTSYLCTVGFVDRESRVLWTAGHCAQEGTSVYSSDGRQKLGVLKHRYQIESPRSTDDQEIMDYFFHDIAYVELSPDVRPGTNNFSGDRTHVPQKGEEICRYGATTNNSIYCGTILATTDQLIYATDLNTQGGDSGGPTWVPGGGYTGQTLGVFTYPGFDYALTIIHRADLAQVVDVHDDSAGTDHYVPNSVELAQDPKTVFLANRAEVFGRQLPTARAFDEYLRSNEITKARLSQTKAQYEEAKKQIISLRKSLGEYPEREAALQAELKKAEAELGDARAQLEEALNARALAEREKEGLRQYLNYSATELKNSQRELEDTQRELANSRQDLDYAKLQLSDSKQRLESTTQELEKSKQQLEESQEAHEQFKQASETGLIISIIMAVLGFMGAIFGGIAASGKLPFRLPA